MKKGIAVRLGLSSSVLLLGIWGDLTLSAQVVPDEVVCETCSIRVEEVLRLGETNGPGFIPGRPLSVVQDHLGRYWTLCSGGELPAVYSPTGQFLKRVGRVGEGPGEFKWAHILLPLPGDSVAIFDADLLRVSILDADLETARTVRIPAGFRTAVVADWPVVIANGVARTAGDFGHPYHVLSLGQDVGSIEVSFGGDGEPATPRSRSTLTHFLARGDHGSLWTVPRKEYSVRKWAFSGAPLARLDRKPAWFPGESRFGPGGPNLEPPPNTNGLMADSLGRIWTFVNVPREEEAWRATWAHVPPDYSGPLDQRDAPEPEELWSTIVEVMEPGSGRVFARGEMDDVVLAVLADRTLAVYRENEEGIPYIAVLEIFLDADGPAT